MENTLQKPTEPVRFREKLGFGTFSAASNLIFYFKDLFYLFFLTNVLGIKMADAGLIITLGIIWDAINDPLVGYLAVNHRFKNGEQCRPFALYCAVPWAVTTVLMFTGFDVAYKLKLGIAIAIYFLFELFNTFAAIPYNSMGGLATNRDEDRRGINVARNLGGCVGSGIGSVAPMPLVGLFGGLDEQGNVILGEAGQRALFICACILGCICIGGCLVHYLTTRERVKQVAVDETRIGIVQVVRMLLSCRSWVMNMLYVLFYGMMNLLIMSNITYYATYILGSAKAATPIMAVFLGTAVVATFLCVPVDRKLGRRRTMILAAVIYILGKIPFVLDPRSTVTMYINGITTAVAMNFAFIMFNTNRNNIADLIEWQSGRRIDSMISTCENLVSKLSKATVSWTMTRVLASTGFDAELPRQPLATENAICALLGWVPMIAAAAMLVSAFFHPIEKETAQMRRQDS